MSDRCVVDLIGYREWARDIAVSVWLDRPRRADIHFHASTDDACPIAPLTYLVGWSEIVPPEFYRDRTVLVLHPSALPAYRGGSPIQHQIIDGIDESAVTLFRLRDGDSVDGGPIAWQRPYDLRGALSEVLNRISTVGAAGVSETIRQFIDGTITYREQEPQGGVLGFTRRRRTPAESELRPVDFDRMTARQLHDFVRALAAPYPNAFITGSDGQRVYITGSRLDEEDRG